MNEHKHIDMSTPTCELDRWEKCSWTVQKSNVFIPPSLAFLSQCGRSTRQYTEEEETYHEFVSFTRIEVRKRKFRINFYKMAVYYKNDYDCYFFRKPSFQKFNHGNLEHKWVLLVASLAVCRSPHVRTSTYWFRDSTDSNLFTSTKVKLTSRTINSSIWSIIFGKQWLKASSVCISGTDA